MGHSPRAVLAYGIDLGTPEAPKIREVDEYGYVDLEVLWPESDPDADFEAAALSWLVDAYQRFYDPPIRPLPEGLTEADYVRNAYGVAFVSTGSALDGDSPGLVLIVADSDRAIGWTDTLAIRPDEMERTARQGDWAHRLRNAVRRLGIHPTQEEPSWLIFAQYG